MSIKTRLTELLHYMRDMQLSFRDHLPQAEIDKTGTATDWSARDVLPQLFDKAFFAKMLALDGDDNWRGVNRYNQACIYARSGQSAAAIEALREALRLEPQLIEWSKQDSDLASLRDEPGYAALYS